MINSYIEMAKDKRGLSQNGLAKELGISGAALSKIVNGGSISQETLAKLSRICGVKPEKLLAEYELSRPHTPEVKAMWERIAGHAAVWAMTSLSALVLLGEGAKHYILC